MAFKDIITKIQHSILCCTNRERKCPLDIGSPTDVRCVNVSDAIPGLTDAERKYIREKASCDAIHLLGLQSHPPSQPSSQPTTSPSSPEHSLHHIPNSALSSREPSMALLNAASKDLPDAIPTPPRQTHHPTSLPSARMKSMWDSTSRLSNNSSYRENLYSKIEDNPSVHRVSNPNTNSNKNKPRDTSTTLTLESESDNTKKRSDSPRTLSLASGFEIQDTVGGYASVDAPTTRHEKSKRVIESMEVDSSDDEDPFVAAERKLLVKN